jgi:phosphate transport system protein
MKHNEKELFAIKDEVSQMWKLVLSQLEKAKQAFLSGDAGTAREIISREKRVDAFELKIDCDCENYIALFSPVAVDLRLALSLIKISGTLERIADFCEGIARHIIEEDCNELQTGLVEELQLEKMFDMLISMLSDSFVALEAENTKMSGKILSKDNEVDNLYRNAVDILTKFIVENDKIVENGERRTESEKKLSPLHSHLSTAKVRCGLKMILLIRKLERIGDHCSNIVEEIVFYVDAKVLKHSSQ